MLMTHPEEGREERGRLIFVLTKSHNRSLKKFRRSILEIKNNPGFSSPKLKKIGCQWWTGFGHREQKKGEVLFIRFWDCNLDGVGKGKLSSLIDIRKEKNFDRRSSFPSFIISFVFPLFWTRYYTISSY